MFVMTAKLSKTRIAAIFVLLLALAVLVVMLLSGRNAPDPELQSAPGGDTEDARLSFLAQYGWDVDTEPVTVQQVTLPENEDNEAFAHYNELQKSQGFDLLAHAGKTATRYVYELLNYPDAKGPVYVTLLVCEGKIVGGDVTDTGPGGKLHGFQLPA